MPTTGTGESVTLFTAVDHTADPDFFVRFLAEVNALAGIRAAKPVILDGLTLSGGERVLDLGCGTGDDAFELAELVGPNGEVVGVDISETMIRTAQNRLAGRDLPISFEVGDAQALRFATGEFDAVRLERLLMHVADVDAAIAELIRVTKPGGRISVFDFDWDSMVIDSPHRETTRAIVRGFSDGIHNGWIGRQLRRRLREHGLLELTVQPHEVLIHREFAQLLLGGFLTGAQRSGLLEPAAIATWWQSLQAADESGDFFGGVTGFIVAGSKPLAV